MFSMALLLLINNLSTVINSVQVWCSVVQKNECLHWQHNRLITWMRSACKQLFKSNIDTWEDQLHVPSYSFTYATKCRDNITICDCFKNGQIAADIRIRLRTQILHRIHCWVFPAANLNQKLIYIYYFLKDRQSHNNTRIHSMYADAVMAIINCVLYKEENAAICFFMPWGWKGQHPQMQYNFLLVCCTRSFYCSHCPLVSCVDKLIH